MSTNSTKHVLAYKTIDDVDLTVDLYLPDETKFGQVAALTRQILAQASGRSSGPREVDGRLPLLIFWHGGGLVAGGTEWTPKWLVKDALDAGFAVAAPNYTLITPFTGHDVLADLKDFHLWVDTKLNTLLATMGSQLVDLDRVAVSGASAGGFLSYLSAVHAPTKPRAVFSAYGMAGDLLSDFYLKPKTEPWVGEVPFAGHPRQFDALITDSAPFVALQQSNERVFVACDGVRLPYGDWLLRTATYLDALTGIAGLSATLAALPYAQRAAAVPESARALFPQFHRITKDSPPLIMIHGLEDTIVHPQESREVKRRYDEAGAVAELVQVAEREHAWEIDWEESEGELKRVVAFLVKHTAKR